MAVELRSLVSLKLEIKCRNVDSMFFSLCQKILGNPFSSGGVMAVE